MTARLAHICRHPVKSVGFEEMPAVALTAGACLPLDREWAVVHEAAKFEELAEWQPKMNFLRGVAGHQLMAIRAEVDEAARRVRLTHPTAGEITVAPDTEGAALIDWLRPLWPANRPAPSRVGHVTGQAMTDVPAPFVAILNHASNRALGQALGRDLSIHRWRGNLWVDGWAPWEEFDLIGRRLRIGAAEIEIRERITRCEATTVNPATGTADADTLGTLNARYDHQDFGVYGMVVASGPVSVGDAVEVI
jgi:uncharacterized protein